MSLVLVERHRHKHIQHVHFLIYLWNENKHFDVRLHKKHDTLIQFKIENRRRFNEKWFYRIKQMSLMF